MDIYMRHRAGTVLAKGKSSLFVVFLLLGGCRLWSPNSAPTVTFNVLPAADAGGPEKLVTIEGRATGVRRGQQEVLYVKSKGLQSVQQFTHRPFTKTRKHSNGQNQT